VDRLSGVNANLLGDVVVVQVGCMHTTRVVYSNVWAVSARGVVAVSARVFVSRDVGCGTYGICYAEAQMRGVCCTMMRKAAWRDC
jgi:hypothetical protein